MSHSSRYILSAAAMIITSGCSFSDGEVPSTVKSQTSLAPASSVGLPVATLLDAGAGVATLLDGGAGSATAAQAASADPNGLADPSVLAKLRDLALWASSVAGVPSPMTMLTVAASDHQAAETALSGAIVNDHAPVYVIRMTGGPFTARRHPPGVPAPQGAVLRVTVDAASYRITDIGYVDVEPDLSQIGPTVVNLLAQ